MAQYPVEDSAGLFEAVNYLLSGPSGLGQNFNGFSAYQPAYVTGTFRAPFTVSTATTSPPIFYVAPINITNITPLEVNTVTNKTRFIQIDFTPQATIPFGQGDTVILDGIISNEQVIPNGLALTRSGNKPALATTSTYNGIHPTITTGAGTGTVTVDIVLQPTAATTYDNTNTNITLQDGGTSGFAVGDTLTVPGTSIGGTTPTDDLILTVNTVTNFYNDTYTRAVLACTTSSVLLQTISAYEWPTYVSSGTIQKNNSLGYVSTDANARVTVTGPTELVFISSQLTLDFSYTCTTTSTFDVTVAVNRYSGTKDSGPGAVDYVFDFDKTISLQTHSYSSTSSGIATAGQNIFTTVLDQPSFGYYWYITEILFSPKTGDVKPGVFEVGLRSTTAQVIKQ